MSDQEHPPASKSLPVLPNSGKVEQLRQAEAVSPTSPTTPAAATAPKHSGDSTLVSRFADSSKTPKQKRSRRRSSARFETCSIRKSR
jgi:hypothetical protein